jgi:hypothetical protein
MQGVKPAAANGGPRTIRICDWTSHFKGTLVGFFTAVLPSGMVVERLMLHDKGGARWVSQPAREWTDQQGVKQYAPLIGFIDRGTRERFQEVVLAALDRHLEGES